MGKKPYVDGDVCISCNLCVDVVPEVFRINDDGVSEVYDPSGAGEEKIQQAIDSCPVTCISWQ